MKKGVKILIIVLVMIIVGLVTFIVVDKVTNKDDNNSKENVANATTNTSSSNTNTTSEENEATEKNKIEDNKKEESKSNSSNEASKKIAEALKERRFMAKNGIDIESEAKFMKVGENVYFIRVTDKSEDVAIVTDFVVKYEDGTAVFEKTEADKHAFELEVDTKNHIVKATRTMKGQDRAIFYDVSKGKLTVKDEFSKPYDESYADMYKYTVNSNEVSEEEYNKKMKEYDKYDFNDFEDNAYTLNDENIDKIVK